MLCLKAEAVVSETYSAAASHGVFLPVSLGDTVRRMMHGKPRRGGPGSCSAADPGTSSSASSSAEDAGYASCSAIENMDSKGERGDKMCCYIYQLEQEVSDQNMDSRGERGDEMCCYRSQLEQEVKNLQKQLQEEIDLHVVLANAVGYDTVPSMDSSSKLPHKAQELLASIAALEITVSKLEEELAALRFRLSYERNEHRLSESNLRYLSSPSPEPPSFSSSYTWEEYISSLRDSKLSEFQVPHSLQQDLSSSYGHSQPVEVNRLSDRCSWEGLQISEPSGTSKEGKAFASVQQPNRMDLSNNFLMGKLWHHPNQLSEEMVRCMRDIFLCLSDSSDLSSKMPSVPSSSSPLGHLSRSSLASLSDSSTVPSSMQTELLHNGEVMDLESTFDPYGVNGKVNWKNMGRYILAVEVSWMSVRKTQLEYAAEALKRFRFLVEQLAKVNPVHMNNNERLAFWINLYNALIMHAYLAYGVPKSDIKLFYLMQKASYTIGGQSFSAADIEFVILKMKPPAHRPQIALILALHKFKISEKHQKYSIDSPEPLAVFALSCGMYSSPAVKIFSADHVQEELKNGMRDYIRASIGISNKGKLLVPKLLHAYAKGVVEDSLLVDWICRHLTPDQVTIVRDSTSQRKQRLLGVRSFSLVPFDSRFRYLFLPDSKSSKCSS